MKFFWHLCLVGLLCAIPTLADDPKPLEKVPKDAAFFAHIKIGNVLETTLVKELLKPLDPKLRNQLFQSADLEKEFGFTLADLESLTLVLPRVGGDDPIESGYAVVVTKKAIDKKKLTAKLKRTWEGHKHGFPPGVDPPIPLPKIICGDIVDGPPKEALPPKKKLPENVLPLEMGEYNMVFVGEREFILVSDHALDSVLNLKVKETGPHNASLKKAASNDFLAVIGYHPSAGVEESIPPEALPELKDYLPAILPAHGEVTLTMKKGVELEGTWLYSNEEKAKEGVRAMSKALEMFQTLIEEEIRRGNQENFLAIFTKLTQKQIKEVKPKVDGKTVRFSFNLPVDDPSKMGKLIGEEIEYTAPRMTSQNNLKQIVLALHNYHDSMGSFPSGAILDKKGKPLLSWRVAILPYIEQENLYQQFKLDEPWDSDNNKKLIEKMPKIYLLPSSEDKAGHTRYRVFVGKDAVMGFDKKNITLANITDGTSNTGAVFESADAVIWTKPDEMEFDMKKTTTKSLYFDKRGKTVVSFLDGSVDLIEKKMLDKCLNILVCPNDGEIMPDLRERKPVLGGGDGFPVPPKDATPPPPKE